MKCFIFLTMAMVTLLSGGCDKSDSNDDNTAQVASTGNSQKRKVLVQPRVSPAVEANAPDNFRGSFSLANLALTDPEAYASKVAKLGLSSLADACSDQYNPNTETTQWEGCKAAANVKEKFFLGAGPTDLADLVSKVDSRMSDIFRNADWSYMPCLDATNTAGGSFTDNNTEQTYPAFSEYKWSGSYTFEDGKTFDSGLDAYLSCYSSLGENPLGGTSWIAYGRKDGDYYILEGQTAGIGSLAKLSSTGDVELYFAAGTKPSSFPASFDEELAVDNKTSTGIVHLKSFADTGFMELTTVGLGPGVCGTHLVTNGKLMYIEMNENEIGACFATDTGINSMTSKRNDGGARSYDASFDNQKFCLDVSSTTKILAYDSLEPCNDIGLSNSTFQLTSLKRENLRGVYGIYMFSTDPKDLITEVTFVPVNSGQVEGSDRVNEGFDIIEETNSKIDTACSTAAADKKDITLFYRLDIDSYLKAKIAEIEASPNKSSEFEASDLIAEQVASMIASTGDTAAKVDFTISASAGGLKWADFDLSVSLKLDGTEIASGQYVESTDHTIGAQKISLIADLSSITKTSKLTLEGNGTLQLGCNNTTNSFSTVASARLSYPRLSYTQLPPQDDDE